MYYGELLSKNHIWSPQVQRLTRYADTGGYGQLIARSAPNSTLTPWEGRTHRNRGVKVLAPYIYLDRLARYVEIVDFFSN
jgi:hypothetical protein